MSFKNTLKNFRNANWFVSHPYAYYTLWRRNRRLKQGKPVVFNCELFFDSRCNFKCVHCSISKFQKQKAKQFMDLVEIDRVAKELSRVGAFLCCLVGGEPTMRKDLCDIVRIFNKNMVLPTMITNGYLLTKDLAADLKKAGVFSVGVSFNGGSPESHDAFAQKDNAHQKALEAIEILEELDIRRSICVVPTHESLANGDYENLIQFAAKKGLRVNVNYPALAGEFSGDYSELLSEEELAQARSYFDLPNVTSDFTVLADKYECPAGRKKIYITPDGGVTPCTFIHISFGNILEEPIETIMERIWSTEEFMSRPDKCIVSEDPEWNKKYLEPVFASKELPMDYRDHPILGKNHEG